MRRLFVSFNGKCALGCKHCFAAEQTDGVCNDSVADVMNSITKEPNEFDIIYVSHYKENFVDENVGLELCEKLYDKYQKDLCITSRCVLSEINIRRLKLLNEKMEKNGNHIYWCESVPALESAGITENLNMLPSPRSRIDFLAKLKSMGIYSIVTVRPLFPSSVVETDEINKLLELVHENVDAVITGGLVLTNFIADRLNLDTRGWKFYEQNKSAYLIGAIADQARFVNVDEEIKAMRSKCHELGLPFFSHSTEVIQYLKTVELDNLKSLHKKVEEMT